MRSALSLAQQVMMIMICFRLGCEHAPGEFMVVFRTIEGWWYILSYGFYMCRYLPLDQEEHAHIARLTFPSQAHDKVRVRASQVVVPLLR